MQAEFFELNPGHVQVNQALQWDVFSAQGRLLLHKGSVIQSESQRDRLLERGVYVNKTDAQKPKLEAQRQVYDPFGASAHAPCVCSLVSGAGMPLGEPIVRDTGLPKYAVAAIVGKERGMVRFERSRLFSLVGQGRILGS